VLDSWLSVVGRARAGLQMPQLRLGSRVVVVHCQLNTSTRLLDLATLVPPFPLNPVGA
jgi:hypothetical protein